MAGIQKQKPFKHWHNLCFLISYRRSSSNISGFNSEMCPDDQSVCLKAPVQFIRMFIKCYCATIKNRIRNISRTTHLKTSESFFKASSLHLITDKTFCPSAQWGTYCHKPGIPFSGAGAPEEEANTHRGQTQLLPQPVEHHEELHRQRVVQDPDACEYFSGCCTTRSPTLRKFVCSSNVTNSRREVHKMVYLSLKLNKCAIL